MGLKFSKRFIIGVDEVGRGPLAGPVTVGIIVAGPLNLRCLKGIKDSKKLTARQREKWFAVLKENFECRTASVGSKTIDRIGIQKAASLGVARVLRSLKGDATSSRRSHLQSAKILLDGLLKAPKHYKQKTIIKGDEKVPVISAASIIAKVTRDKKMTKFHKKYPQYGFDKHKGYGTKHHYKMLKRHGPCQIHRKTFRLTNNVKRV